MEANSKHLIILTAELSQHKQYELRYCVMYFYNLRIDMTYEVIVAELLSYKANFLNTYFFWLEECDFIRMKSCSKSNI